MEALWYYCTGDVAGICDDNSIRETVKEYGGNEEALVIVSSNFISVSLPEHHDLIAERLTSV